MPSGGIWSTGRDSCCRACTNGWRRCTACGRTIGANYTAPLTQLASHGLVYLVYLVYQWVEAVYRVRADDTC
eukprot:4347107-Pyramimonas_sp.AAC.1